jgi:hypothetical protein
MGSPERRARAKVALPQRILAIYLHVPDKASILTALCDETFEKLAARLTTHVTRTTDPLARLRRDGWPAAR